MLDPCNYARIRTPQNGHAIIVPSVILKILSFACTFVKAGSGKSLKAD